ncbi:DUF6206 family protein [Streptomyces lasiicapitis]|uniref:Uncharacterized protein n=1 Tax=Streptomyces lasiicapitis TaxID=1923961 RepID=A0ABQ2LKL8_9ACTN|nr:MULTISPECIES: DUF6206 family protein [Streptomyces]QIB42391.1 hypothetical protein G3H79_04185 [Streptomyces aureoverticillatus]GGO37520.1 hypothetical protein GCM10012286_11120 [Streptomyces lasiicapitis]
MTFTVPHAALEHLESQVRQALRTADDSALDVLGYGEITLVLRLRTDGGSYACKRLPVFPDQRRFESYRGSLDEYLRRLADRGLAVAPTEVWHTRAPSGRVTAYCVQRELPSERLCSRLLHSEDEVWAKNFFARFLDRVDATVHAGLGLDAQASNWIDQEGELTYLDVTTPLMRDARGRERLDVRLFFTSLPWVLRDAVRLSMAGSIFDKFYATRGVLLDFLGNLHKERLDGLIPAFLEQANARLAQPLTAAEVAAYYRADARMWELIQRLRAADRLWHRKVRRRTYPFLLPPPVAR